MSPVRILDGKLTHCPFCNQDAEFTGEGQRCSSCNLPVPEEVRCLSGEAKPLIVQTFGSSLHGKTTYLCALTMTLARMASVWDGYYLRAVTQRSRLRLREVNSYAQMGSLPPSFTDDGDEPTILMLQQLGDYGDRLLVYSDCPGEAFDDVRVDPERVPFLRSATATFFIASLQDLDQCTDGRSVDMLMDSLVASLEQQDVDLKRESRCAVLVLTKGDMVTDLPASLRRYLASDPLWSSLESRQPGISESQRPSAPLPSDRLYLEEMQRIDAELQDWVETRCQQGPTLARIAQDKGIDLHFSLVSATGSEPDETNHLTIPWHPRRVIDPFLWALEFRPASVTILDRGFRRFRRGVRLLWD